MKLSSFKIIFSAGISIALVSCGNNQTTSTNTDTAQTSSVDSTKTTPSIKTDSVAYTFNGKQSKGYIAYDENRKGKLPVVVVIPEWWGINTYTMGRARQLADLGYFAIDADLFGHGDTAANPKEAMAFTKPFYMNPQLALTAVNAAIAKAATYSQADTSRMAAIGYCFGGFIVLNAAKLGAPLKATVSFHGGLDGVQPKKDIVKGDILVCQGGADQLVPEKAQSAFKKSMDSAGIHYSFVVYPGAMHAFSNPNATALGEKFKLPLAYNGAADTASWKAMQDLFVTALK
jgi:dienelactone hydrolase